MNKIDQGVKKLRHVFYSIFRLSFKEPFVKLEHWVGVFGELYEAVRVSKQKTIVKSLYKAHKEIVVDLAGHVFSVKGVLLNIPPRFQIDMRPNSFVKDAQPNSEIHQRVDLFIPFFLRDLLNLFEKHLSPWPNRPYKMRSKRLKGIKYIKENSPKLFDLLREIFIIFKSFQILFEHSEC